VKKRLKILCGLFTLLFINNVGAARMYFIDDCPSSESAAANYGITLNGSGWYNVPSGGSGDDGLDGSLGPGGSNAVCNGPSSNVLACDFGCVDAALSGTEISANNASILSDLNAGSPIEGNSFCKMVCIPTNQFDYPGFIPTVEQGTKFTWTIGGSSGVLDTSLSQKILKLTVTTECAVVFDIQSWKTAYSNARNAIISYNTLVNTYGTEYNATSITSNCSYKCPSGYTLDGSYCIPNNPPTTPIPATYSCDTTYSCVTGYDLENKKCYLQQSVYNNAVAASNTITQLKAQALACSNYDKSPASQACGTAYLSYSDEKYGGDSHKIKLDENSGGTSKVSGWNSKSTTLTVTNYTCGSFGSSCSGVTTTSTVNHYKKAKFVSRADWTLPEYFYRYVLYNGVSIFNYHESPAINNNTGTDSYYGNYNNYIDIGFPNFPVNFNSSVGNHKISVDFSFCSSAGVYAGKTTSASCPYKVTNCEEGKCPPSDDVCVGEHCDSGTTGTGHDVVYRTIDLNNPFPGLDGEERLPGLNWSINNTYVSRYITHNRGVDTEEVYSKEPMYRITLTPSLIQDIRNYNKENDLNDFRMVCKNGQKCRSIYLRQMIENGQVSGCGTENNFDACALVDGR